MTLGWKKHLDGASGCLTYGGALLDQCMEGIQHQKMAQRDGDGWVASTELLGRHAAAWFLGAQVLLSA